ncbi:hypothetical protein [Pedobacter caeni]|uniref:Uncharacterized protein n=1 Tax=Pedobacter caeni TaxID=288992 RepID=A0A1M5K2V1_9SPHI|nr:hypothetical protein [Pedobacter caeni]SHG46900.1 hypothetical protein SAMN04488522_105596 [Pedobacter caeni]
MAAKKKENLKMLLQKMEPDAPASDFMALVMKEISTDTNLEVPINIPLQNLLKQHGVASLSADFTNQVMDRIELLPLKKQEQPIISKRAGFAIVASFLFISLLFFLFTENTSTPSTSTNAYHLTDQFSKVTEQLQVNGSPSLYLIVMVMLGVLLGLDYYLRYFQQQQKA